MFGAPDFRHATRSRRLLGFQITKTLAHTVDDFQPFYQRQCGEIIRQFGEIDVRDTYATIQHHAFPPERVNDFKQFFVSQVDGVSINFQPSSGLRVGVQRYHASDKARLGWVRRNSREGH